MAETSLLSEVRKNTYRQHQSRPGEYNILKDDIILVGDETVHKCLSVTFVR